MSVGAAVREAARLWRGLMGDDAYARYAAHVAAEHPDDAAVLSEREFWRGHQDGFDPRTRGGCC